MRKRVFLAYLGGDYEGVRARLDALARQGWELTGRAGPFTGTLEPTRRTELYYDVLPAQAWRGAQQLRQDVEARESAGWEAVDTIWGMDIYKSMPCRLPTVERSGETFAAVRAVFLGRLPGAAAFAAVMPAVLGLHGPGLSRAGLLRRWYLSDSRTALLWLLPVLLACGGLYLLWLVYCLLFRCRLHRPPGRFALLLRAGVRLTGLTAAVLLAAVLWTAPVPRLWLRLTLLALGALLLPLSRRLGGRGTAAGVCALLLLTMVLSAAVKPVQRELAGVPVLSASELELAPEGPCRGWYEEEASLLVRQIHVYQSWESGERVELTCYRCLTSRIAGLAARDRTGEQVLRRGRTVCAVSADAPLSDAAMERILDRLGGKRPLRLTSD